MNVPGPADVDATAARDHGRWRGSYSTAADRAWGARMFQFHDPDGFKLGVSTPLEG